MKQDNEYSNANAIKAILLIILIVVITIGYFVYNGTISVSFNRKEQGDESKIEPVFETPLAFTAYYEPITLNLI